MKEQQVTQILQEIAEQEVSDSLNLWPAIRAQAQSQRRPSRWARVVPATRLGWAFLALALCLALGAVAYAVAPILERVFRIEAGLYDIEQAGLVQELDLSQTTDGITVTLQRVYADANRIVVGYTVSGPEGLPTDRHLLSAGETLSDATGTIFPWEVGHGITGPSDLLEEVSSLPGEGAYVLSFDAAAVKGAPETLDLRLVMDVETYVVPTPVPPTPGVYENRGPLEPVMPVSTAGPFTFDFSVPFTPGHALEAQQTVKAAGVAVKLERVVITPSETRAYLCFDPPDGESEDWWPTVSWSTAGGQIYGAGPGFYDQVFTLDRSARTMVNRNGEGPCYSCSVLASLDDQSGEWTLTVTELVGYDPAQPGEQTRLAGPCVFRFQVP